MVPTKKQQQKQFMKTNKLREKEKREFSRNDDKFPPTKIIVVSVSRMAYQQQIKLMRNIKHLNCQDGVPAKKNCDPRG